MKKLILIPLFLVIVLGVVTSNAYAITIKYAFAFADRFPDEAEPLDFCKGNVFQIGAVIKPGDSPITEATATNLDTGLVLKLAPRQHGPIHTNLFLHMPLLNPNMQQWVWEIRAKDEKGNEAVAKTHRFDKVGEMPYVKNIKASGNSLAPMITWDAPVEKDYPAECKIKYRVRLLKAADNQFYKSKKLLSVTKEQIPEGLLKPEDIPDTYVRIESQCWDSTDTVHPVPVELKSETFLLLKEALDQ